MSHVNAVLTPTGRLRLARLVVDDGWPLLAFTDPATGTRIKTSRSKINSGGGGHKVLGRRAGRRNRRPGTGYWYIHNAVDDHSRLAYSELLDDERKETAAAF